MLAVLEVSGLLGRGVFQFSEEHAGLGQAVPAFSFGELLGDPEVDDLHQQFPVVVLRQHDVLGRDVAMDQSHRVQVIQSAQGLNGDLHREARRNGSVLGDPLLDVRAVDELPDHVVRPVVELGEVVQHGQVAVLDHRRRARFLEEALQRLIVLSDVRPHDLDHAQLVEMDVPDLEDLAHAAHAEAVDDLVLAVDEAGRVGALEQRDLVAAMRTEVVRGVDGRLALQAVNGLGRLSHVVLWWPAPGSRTLSARALSTGHRVA